MTEKYFLLPCRSVEKIDARKGVGASSRVRQREKERERERERDAVISALVSSIFSK